MSVNAQRDKEHILLLAAAFPGPTEPSRAVFVANAARLLAQQFKVTVLTPRVHAGDPLRETLPCYNVVRFPYHSGGRILKHHRGTPVPRLISYFSSGLAAALRTARSNRISLIYANWVLPAGLIGVLAASLLHLPLVVHACGSDINVYARKNPLFGLLARLVLKRSDRVLALGLDLQRTLETEFHIPPGGTIYCPPVVDTSLFSPGPKEEARRQLGIPVQGKVALFVADFTAAKGADLFFNAAVRIAKSRPHTRFIMLGDGPLRHRLLTCAVEPAVSLPGALPNEKVAAYMKAADLLVLPSFTEGRPVSVLEAMQTGLPVLATRVGDIPQMITDGGNGILIEPGDRRALAKRLDHLLSDTALLARLRSGMSKTRAAAAPVLSDVIRGALERTDYDRYWRCADALHLHQRAKQRARAALSLLPISAGTAFDAGCGRGEMLELLSSLGFKARGVDISSVAAAIARRRGLNVWVLDLEKDPLEGACDAVFCLELLEHLRQPAAVLGKLAAAVRPGGALIVSLPNEKNIYHRLKNLLAPNPSHLHRFTHGRALELFAHAGLGVLRRRPVALLPLGLFDRALCALLPGLFAISNVYLLSTPGAELDESGTRK